MRDYSKISPKFWLGDTGIKLREAGPETQLVALYLLTCLHANMIGVYYLPLVYIAHDIGLSEEAVASALEHLVKLNFCSYDSVKKYVWVHEMARHQIAIQLDPKDKRVKAVNDALAALPELSFLSSFYHKYKFAFHLSDIKPDEEREMTSTQPSISENFLSLHPFEGPSKPLRSQEQYQKQEQKQKQEQEQEEENKHRRVLRHSQDDEFQKMHIPTASCVAPLFFDIAIPLCDGSEFYITQAMVDEWKTLYPLVNIEQQLKSIRGWNLANPTKRKSANTLLQHVTGWLKKENLQQPDSFTRSKPNVINLFDHNTRVAKAWLNETQSVN